MLTQAELRADPTRSLHRHEFRSMGMDVALISPEPMDEASRWAFHEAVTQVELVFRQADARFSRFAEDSELSKVNRGAGRWQLVSPQFAEVTRRALDGARATEGLFDPTILPELIAAGYDRDYHELLAQTPVVRDPPAAPRRYREVRLEGRLLHLPRGGALDFGGLAKGWAVDQAARTIRGLSWAVVDAGGDLRVVGPITRPVPIGIADPHHPGTELLQVELDDGALATSSVVGRAWGEGLHHLIDPRTSLPARTGVVQATVWAKTCAEAEILSKWVLLSGPRVVGEVPAAVVMDDGRVLVSFEETVPC